MKKTRILMLGALAALLAPASAMAQFFGTFDPDDAPTVVPEPGTLTLLATGVGVIALARMLRDRRDRDD